MKLKHQIKHMMDSFCYLTGLKLALIDNHDRGLAVSGHRAGDFCTLLHREQACLFACLRSNQEVFGYVRRTKEPYLYRCPFGLLEIVVPIKAHEAVCGILIAGPILEERESGKSLLCAQAAEHGYSGEGAELEAVINEIRCYSAEQTRALCDMLILLAEYIGQSGELWIESKTVGQMVKDYVKRNLSGRITLEELALHIHCSTVTVTEHFRREFGITVMQYILKKRMALATQLLLESEYSIGDIAASCGFCDAEYFSRRFKRVHGISPMEYRKQIAKSPTKKEP